jgi:hypothetical protein
MTLAELKTAIAGLKLPFMYGYLPDRQACPYIAYAATTRNAIHADGVVVYCEEWIALRFVSKKRDLTTEQAIEAMLTANGIGFDDPDLEFDEEQEIHTATYYFQI